MAAHAFRAQKIGLAGQDIADTRLGNSESPKIHAALAYFYDHQEEFERQIREQEGEVAAWQAELGESPLQRRLRQLKLNR